MQKSPFRYSIDNKRYHTLNYHIKNRFDRKIYKAVIECGFTCPNIDGTKGIGGCIFCDGGSGYFTRPDLTVTQQLDSEYSRLSKKYENAEMIAYFQANTNTYGDISHLRKLYTEALAHENVVGLSIGTRADCLSDEVLDLLEELNSRTYLTVELGMQTVHEETLRLINRCCTHSEFVKDYDKLKKRGIRTCLHIINGLPFESHEMMLETARRTAEMHPDAVKIQMLHVIKGTRLEEMYLNSEFSMLSRDEYINIVAHQLEVLPPETVIERITGDGDKSKLIAPMWTADKIAVLGGIDKKLAELDTWQGRLYDISHTGDDL